MKTRLVVLLGVAAGVSLGSLPLFAHHSLSRFDREHPSTLKGMVVEFNWMNPHSRVLLDVKDDKGNIARWALETSPPIRLLRVGWNAESLKPGDQVTVTVYPAKDGSKIAEPRDFVFPDGRKLGPAMSGEVE